MDPIARTGTVNVVGGICPRALLLAGDDDGNGNGARDRRQARS